MFHGSRFQSATGARASVLAGMMMCAALYAVGAAVGSSASDTALVVALSVSVGILITFGGGLLAWFTKLNTGRREEMESQQRWVAGLQESQQRALQEHDLATAAMMRGVGESLTQAARMQASGLEEVRRRLDVNTLVVQSALAVQSATGKPVDPETLDRLIERVKKALP